METDLWELDKVILSMLSDKALKPSQISDMTKQKRQAVSRSLRKLKDLNMIEPFKGNDKRETYYTTRK